MNRNVYPPLDERQVHIDKTSSLEKGIAVFPFIYMEGAAASGKTEAVRILLSHHPEVRHMVFRLDQEQNLKKKLVDLKKKMTQEPYWVIFEHVHAADDPQIFNTIRSFLEEMPDEARAIFISRECPPKEFLDYIWKNQMQLISPEQLLFDIDDIQSFLQKSQSQLNPKTVYEVTGGWAGCVSVMIRLAGTETDAKVLIRRHEISSYINYEIIEKLQIEEQQLLSFASQIPWISKGMCIEFLGEKDWDKALRKLERKGILHYQKERECWYTLPLFRSERTSGKETFEIFSGWYEQRGYYLEAEQLLKKSGNREYYREFLYRNYDKAAFIQIEPEFYEKAQEQKVEMLYIEGVDAWKKQDYAKLNRVIHTVHTLICDKKEQDKTGKEIYLNLQYMNPSCTTDEWLDLLQEYKEKGRRIRLYALLGNGCTYLSGVRDLSGLFACTQKEESRKARIWKENFGEREWIAYCLARYDYYLETNREDVIKEDDEKILKRILNADLYQKEAYKHEIWRFRLAALYLLYKKTKESGQEVITEQIAILKDSLLRDDDPVCRQNAEAVISLYSIWSEEQEQLSRWMRRMDSYADDAVSRNNFVPMFCLIKGYLIYNHYDKAEKVLNRFLPYLKKSGSHRFYAEALFQLGIIHWQQGKTGRAIQNIIESFVVNGNARYVRFYIDYGKNGYELLEAHVDWIKQNAPENWYRKKKYNYGNVLRMPMEDYMETLLRLAKKKSGQQSAGKSQFDGEHLTMMETIILQDISRGLTNAEICEAQKLKLPTVKSHIYSLYKKLGVNSRVQAVNKGKEMGIVR